MKPENHVILLNKPFLGGWLDAKGNIGHEVIDFLQTDDGQYYIYNNPIGFCPTDIWIDGTTELKRLPEEKYIGKYLVLTSEKRGNDFDILYVIELKEKLHRYHAPRKNKEKLRHNQERIKELIRKRNIKYNNKYLDEVYSDDDSLFLTFRGNRLYKANKPITVTGLSYNFQRNKGYLYEDKEYSDDYKKVLDIVEGAIKNGLRFKSDQESDENTLREITPMSVNGEQIGRLETNKTFINLIKQEDNEQIFTNILYDILKEGELLKHFCERFKGDRYFDSKETFEVSREVGVVSGRMDVCAESESQRVIIENKIDSGLNGIKPIDNTSQLSTYYRWGIEKPIEPLCFVVAPNYRYSEILREIAEKDPEMVNIYQVKTYGDIAKFIEDEMLSGNISKDYSYYSLLPQIIDAFKNLSYSTKEGLYAGLFLDATNS